MKSLSESESFLLEGHDTSLFLNHGGGLEPALYFKFGATSLLYWFQSTESNLTSSSLSMALNNLSSSDENS